MSLKAKIYLVGCLLAFTLSNTLSANIKFLQKDLSEVRQMAAQEGKLYFAHFSAEWCMVCVWMEENTFTDPSLKQLVEDNYLAVKINFDEPNNQRYNEQFQIKALPTILIFNSQGVMLNKIQYSIEANELLRILQKYNLPRNKVSVQIEPTKQVMSSPKWNRTLHRPALLPDKAPDTYIANNTPNVTEQPVTRPSFGNNASSLPNRTKPSSPKVRRMPHDTEISTAYKPATPNKYRYSESMPPANPPTLSTFSEVTPRDASLVPRSSRKYYVELGVYSTYEKAQEHKLSIEEQLGEKVHLKSSLERNQTLYRVTTSEFPDFSSAQQHYRMLKEKSVFGLIQLVE